MIKLSNTVAQTVEPGQALTFNEMLNKSGCGECHRNNSSSVKLCARGLYDITFTGNIDGATAAAPAQLALSLGGDIMPETTMISSATGVNNISVSTGVRNCCCDYDRITVVNNGTVPVTVSPNPLLYIRRVG